MKYPTWSLFPSSISNPPMSWWLESVFCFILPLTISPAPEMDRQKRRELFRRSMKVAELQFAVSNGNPLCFAGHCSPQSTQKSKVWSRPRGQRATLCDNIQSVLAMPSIALPNRVKKCACCLQTQIPGNCLRFLKKVCRQIWGQCQRQKILGNRFFSNAVILLINA